MTTKQDKCDYSKGLIYKIKCLDPEIRDIYVGSTLNEVARRKKHKTNCTSPKNDKYNLCVYQFIRAHGGWDNWKLCPIKLYPCNSRLELRMEEERMIEELEEFTTLNRQRAYCSEETRKENSKKYMKQYYEENKEQISEKGRVKYNCKCGSKYSKTHKAYHEKTKNHQNWLQTGEQKVVKYEKYTCGCGSTLTKRNKSRHEKSDTHQKWLETSKISQKIK